MPLFEYECRHCGHVHEVLARAGAAPPKKCPKCGEPQLERRFSVFATGGGEKKRSCAPRG
ncbi:MAG: zinc ribbon domain-containing protein [Phycisphaerae bacterium]|jgi:putative FmdB family regulatory protein